MATAKQLLVTGSDTPTVCIFCANHYQASATVDKSQPAIFLYLETYFTMIKICIMFSALPDSLSEIKVCIQGEADIFIVCFPPSQSIENFAVQLLIYEMKKRIDSYRMPK